MKFELLSLFQPNLKILQFIGYFPLKIKINSKSSSIRLKKVGPNNQLTEPKPEGEADNEIKVRTRITTAAVFWWTLFLAIVGIVEICVFIQKIAGKKRIEDGFRNPIDCAVFYTNLGFFMFSSLWFKLNGILKRKASARFWSSQYDKLKSFFRHGYESGFVTPTNNTKQFRQVQRSARKHIIWGVANFSAIFLMMIAINSNMLVADNSVAIPSNRTFEGGYNNYNKQSSRSQSTATWLSPANEVRFGSTKGFALFFTTMWAVKAFLHFANIIYMSTFLKVYRTCVHFVVEKVKEVVEIGRLIKAAQMQEKAQAPNKVMVDSTTWPAIEISTFDTTLSTEITMTNENDDTLTNTTNDKKYTSNSNTESASNQQMLLNCILAYHQIEELVEDFNDHFKWEIIAELVCTIVVILIFSFRLLYGMAQSILSAIFTSFLPVCTFAAQIYLLASEAGGLTEEAKVICKYLHLLELEDFPKNLQLKVQMLAMKVSTDPPTILPGHFLKLNRYLLTSIISSITTYLVVLVQFRGASPALSCPMFPSPSPSPSSSPVTNGSEVLMQNISSSRT